MITVLPTFIVGRFVVLRITMVGSKNDTSVGYWITTVTDYVEGWLP